MIQPTRAITGILLAFFSASQTLQAQEPEHNIVSLESAYNKPLKHTPVAITEQGAALHQSMTIMDWHSDTLLWKRSLLEKSSIGHVDLPRMQKGNIAIQMFTVVTKSPPGQNYEENDSDFVDVITGLAKANGWPKETHNNLLERALYQARKLDSAVTDSNGALSWIKNRHDLDAFLEKRTKLEASGIKPVPTAALLGAEGAHPLAGNIDNLEKMYKAGFRMIGLTHFFDNELGGSLHGVSKAGLTNFGKAFVKRMNELNIIIDLAHASEKMAHEVLEITTKPTVVSHTGLKGACDSPRNFNDNLMKKIASAGGVIAVGFWDAAVCDPRPAGIAKSIKYGIELVGEDHIALGSDWDGGTTSITANQISEVTEELLNLGVSESAIHKVMGGNSLRFLKENLPN